jgi:hypothetical protein
MSSCGIAWHTSIEVRSSPIVIGSIGSVGCDEAAGPASPQADDEMISPIITMSNKYVFWFTGSFSLVVRIIDFNFN